MPIGTKIFGMNRLLTSNALIDVESATPALAGGTQYTWAAFESAVDVLISDVQAQQDARAGVQADVITCAVAGVDPSLTRSGIRLKVVEFPDAPDLEGRYLAPTSQVRHPGGRGGLLDWRINLRCQTLAVPGEDGEE
jgi:hypothetical protein